MAQCLTYQSPTATKPGRTLAAVALALVLVTAVVRAQPANEDDKLAAFLERMALPELQVLYLETEVQRRPAGDARRARCAARLADLYSGQLLALTDLKKVEELRGRIDALLKAAPEANTPALQVMLLQGDYNRAEGLAARWLADPSGATAARDEARKILGQIVPRFNEFQDKLHDQLKQAREGLNQEPEGNQRTAHERQVNRLAGVAGRSSYFAGWSNYYLGLMEIPADEAAATAGFRQARASFRRLFDVDVLQDEVDAESLELIHEPRARAALGLALAEFASGGNKAGEVWFRLLRSPQSNDAVRDQVPYWHVWALLHAGQGAQAKTVAEREIASFSDAYTPGKVGLCVLLLRAGYGGKEQRPELGNLGIGGLLRMRQFERARLLLKQYEVSLDSSKSFVMLWMNGQNLLDRAEKGKAPAGYRAAVKALEAALAAEDAGREAFLAGQCRYALGWGLFRLAEYEKALEQFQQAVTVFKLHKAANAADAAWMAASCHQALAAKDPRHKAAALEAFQAFRKDYPNHAYTKRAGEVLARLRNEQPSLEKLDPKDPNFPEACLGVCRFQYGQWKKVRADAAKARAAAGELHKTVQRYLALPAEAGTAEGRLECLLMTVDLALNTRPPDLARARKDLARADALGAALPPENRLAGDYHQAKLVLAQATQDSTEIEKQALWLNLHRKGTAQEELALLVLAQQAETNLKKAGDKDRPGPLAEALKVYRRLVEVLGGTPEKVRANKNAAVAVSRLAAHALEAGYPEEAGRWLDVLLEVYPRDSNYLRRAGLAHYRAKKHERATQCWRVLLAGLPRDSDGWFEAKYYHMAALAQVDRAEARKEFEQFKLLHPELGPPRWRDAIQQLAKSLSQ